MARTSVKVIEDSIYGGSRLTTLEVEYPYYIHAEVMTHRVFSRNAQSFRAIPLIRLIKNISDDKWYPVWMENQQGMEASVAITDPERIRELNEEWDIAKKNAIASAYLLESRGVHKQIINRVITPFSKIKAIISSTEWNNFLRLRLAPDAQQEIQELAVGIRDALTSSTPKKLDLTEWHLPYVTQSERDVIPTEDLIKLSVARCARVSYLNHDGKRDINKDMELYWRLKESKHMSPFEHAATPFPRGFAGGNFKNWRQHRYYAEYSAYYEIERTRHLMEGNY